MLLFVVAVGWVLVLASWLRARTETRGVNSISSFSRHLSVLERTSPARQGQGGVEAADEGAVVRPLRHAPIGLATAGRPGRMTLSQARRRRRDVLVGLGAATAVLAVLALTVGAVFVALFVLAAVAMGAYVALLVRAQRIGAERDAKVRYLPQPTTLDSSGYWLQQSAN